MAQHIPPRSLLIMSITIMNAPCLIQSVIVDLEWARTILAVHQKYPNGEVPLPEDIIADVTFSDVNIRIVDDPELVEAFERTYGNSYGCADIATWVRNGIYSLYQQLTDIDQLENIGLHKISKIFLP